MKTIHFENYNHFVNTFTELNQKYGGCNYTYKSTIGDLIRRTHNREPDEFIKGGLTTIWRYIESFENKKSIISFKDTDRMSRHTWSVWTMFSEVIKPHAPILFPFVAHILPNKKFFVHPGNKRLLLANHYNKEYDVFVTDRSIQKQSIFEDMRKYFERDLYQKSEFQLEVMINDSFTTSHSTEHSKEFPDIVHYELTSTMTKTIPRWGQHNNFSLFAEIKNNRLYINGEKFIKLGLDSYEFDI